jgi:hypothetical protein
MHRYSELSRGAERSSPRQFFPDCTIAMCGYDFREGQGPYRRFIVCHVGDLSIQNETPKMALGDKGLERRFRRQIPHTETKPYLRNAAVPRHFERHHMLADGDRTGWLRW